LNRTILTIVIVLLAVSLATAKSSKLVMSWKNPNYVARKFHRVLALGLSDKTGVRANFEDALAEQLAATGLETIPGNSILLRPEGTQFDLNYLKTQVRENQIDAVVVSRLIKVDNTVTYIPGSAYVAPFPYYNTFYGYYGTVYPVVYSPDYLREEKKVRIETNLYVISSQEGELVWTGVTDTFNPSNIQKAINGLVKLVVKQMQIDQALRPPQ
jgi:ABC-type antimicrobial peptide transport system permease subunit